MVGRARVVSYHLDTPQFVRALFDSRSDEATLLELAACGHIDIYAEGKSWNAVLWLAMDTSTIRRHERGPTSQLPINESH